jgi:hypothetical protein
MLSINLSYLLQAKLPDFGGSYVRQEQEQINEQSAQRDTIRFGTFDVHRGLYAGAYFYDGKKLRTKKEVEQMAVQQVVSSQTGTITFFVGVWGGGMGILGGLFALMIQPKIAQALIGPNNDMSGVFGAAAITGILGAMAGVVIGFGIDLAHFARASFDDDIPVEKQMELYEHCKDATQLMLSQLAKGLPTDSAGRYLVSEKIRRIVENIARQSIDTRQYQEQGFPVQLTHTERDELAQHELRYTEYIGSTVEVIMEPQPLVMGYLLNTNRSKERVVIQPGTKILEKDATLAEIIDHIMIIDQEHRERVPSVIAGIRKAAWMLKKDRWGAKSGGEAFKQLSKEYDELHK